MKKIFTITFGIPAHNEEANIAGLLQSLLSQKGDSFILKKIIVACDGCTDNTAKEVIAVAKNNPKVYLIDDGKRLGKIRRLEQFYSLNTNDIIMICDGDIGLRDPYTIENIVRNFYKNDVGLVTGNRTPIAEKGLSSKLIYTWSRVWYEARIAYNDGHNIHNSCGCLMALKKEFAKKVKFPQGIVSDSQFIYFLCLNNKLKYRFAKDARAYYHKASTIKDYLKQMHRSAPEEDKIAQLYGNWVYKEYQMPVKIKMSALLKMIRREPVYTLLAALFNLWLNHYPQKKIYSTSSGIWETAKSTKKAV